MTDTPTPDIGELMARDPLSHSEQDIVAIVEGLRANRKRFLAGNQKAGSMKPKKPTKKEQDAKASEEAIGSLSDLGL